MKVIVGLIFTGLISLGVVVIEGDLDSEVRENTALVHEGAPDELTNKLDTPIYIHIIDENGKRIPGLNLNNSKKDSILNKGNTGKINSEMFRRGIGKKVELSVTVPGKELGQGRWEYQEIKWFLGKDHEPSFTKTKFHKNSMKGYQLIFVYEDGLAPTDSLEHKLEQLEKGILDSKEAEKWRKHLRIHVDGHICKPDDPDCIVEE